MAVAPTRNNPPPSDFLDPPLIWANFVQAGGGYLPPYDLKNKTKQARAKLQGTLDTNEHDLLF